MNLCPTNRILITAALISGSIAMPTASAALFDDASLNLQLRNEYRNADRPSASGDYGPKIDAWVQGFLFDFESGQVADTVSLNAGLYHVEKLLANPNRSTRFYLDGHDSFSIPYANLAFDFSEQAHITIGQFGADYYYGSLDYLLPLVDESSVRTAPFLRQGAFYEGRFNQLYLYGLYSTRKAGGYDTEWTDQGRTYFTINEDGSMNILIDESPFYAVGGLWENDDSQIALTLSYQEDVANQVMSRGSHSWLNEDNAYFKLEYVGLYAHTIGDTKASERFHDDSFGVSGQLTYNKEKATFLASIGYVGNKLDSPGVDTDIVFPFDQSIDRNGHHMTSWQMGGFYQARENINLGLALVVTDGYSDASKNETIEGTGANLILMHTAQTGPLKGLRSSVILNKANEYRERNSATETLKYYDIKFTGHYDIKLL